MLKAKLIDLENRSCQNNIRITCLPKGIEGPTSAPELDRAHHTLATKLGPGLSPGRSLCASTVHWWYVELRGCRANWNIKIRRPIYSKTTVLRYWNNALCITMSWKSCTTSASNSLFSTPLNCSSWPHRERGDSLCPPGRPGFHLISPTTQHQANRGLISLNFLRRRFCSSSVDVSH